MLGYFGSIKGIHLTPVQSLGLVLALVVLNRNPTGLYKWPIYPMVPIPCQGIRTPQLHLAVPAFAGGTDLNQTAGINL